MSEKNIENTIAQVDSITSAQRSIQSPEDRANNLAYAQLVLMKGFLTEVGALRADLRELIEALKR